jgi:hypothetical protein
MRFATLGRPLLVDRTFPVHIPRIQLLRGWGPPSTGVILDVSVPDDEPPVCGCTYADGYLLRFWSPVVDHMPDRLVRQLVAHELAHVFQSGFDNWRGFDYEDVSSGEVEEGGTHELVFEWGFGEPEELDEWLCEQGYVKRITFASPQEYAEYLDGRGSRYQ